jgi:hypothetical protein
MQNSSNLRTLAVVWLAWALLMAGYQWYAPARFQPVRPDYAVYWTADATRANSQDTMPYLKEPFLNGHVSWDSEYYLSIAVAGYDDPQMRAIGPRFSWDHPLEALKRAQPSWTSMNYAFFPFYPWLMSALMIPLRLFGLNSIATATLAGMLVSLLGTLGAMVALFDLTRDEWGEATGRRAAFYLLIWPASMFLAQVYTEGLFLGLSFGAIALAHRQKWVWAALLAIAATWTRAAGALTLIPLAWYWWQGGGWKRLTQAFSLREVGQVLLLGSPLAAYLIWSVAFGQPFYFIEHTYFQRGLLLLSQSYAAWQAAWQWMLGPYSAGQAYYLVEFAAIGFGLVACVAMARRHPGLALYSVATIVFSLTSGGAQGMHRYVMAAPVLFLLPAHWGQHEAFDRAWTLGNILLMGLFAAMFSFDFWAG